MKQFNENWDGIIRNKNTATLSEAIDWQGDRKKYTFKGVGANGPYTAIFDIFGRICNIELNQGGSTQILLSPENSGEISVFKRNKMGHYIKFALITNKSAGKMKTKQEHHIDSKRSISVERTIDAVKVSTLNNIGALNEFAKWASANFDKITSLYGKTDTDFESAYKKQISFAGRMAISSGNVLSGIGMGD